MNDNKKKQAQDLDKDIKKYQELVSLPFKERLKYCVSQPMELTKTITITLAILWLLTLPFIKRSITVLAVSDAFWILSCLSLGVYIAFMAIDKSRDKGDSRLSKIAAWVFLVAYYVGLIFVLSGYIRGPQEARTNETPTVGTIYVLYSKTCPFCQKAKKGMRTAATLYGYSPINQPVQYVDIDKDTKLANALRKHVKYKATVIKMEGKGVYKTAVYSLKTKSGKPLSVSAGYAYQKLLEVR